jgi:hypothetical protein
MHRNESAERSANVSVAYGDGPVPAPSEWELKQITDAVARALAAWDQYTTQGRLPRDSHWLDQGSHWDDFNNGHLGEQERRDPVVTSAAWNTLEQALLELTNLTARLRQHWGMSKPVLPFQDRRMGTFSRVSGPLTETMKAADGAASAA